MKKIAVLMSGRGAFPSGNHKVLYEYADRLVSDGYDVCLLYPCLIDGPDSGWIKRVGCFVKAVWRYVLIRLHLSSFGATWFPLDSRVRERVVFSLKETSMPEADVYMATSVETAFCLNGWKMDQSRKCYFIQHIEAWNGVTEKRVFETFGFPFLKIVTSGWLKEAVSHYDSNWVQIPNGFDFDFFKMYRPIEKRDGLSLAMMYHESGFKGSSYGIDALTIVRSLYPAVKVRLFGGYDRPDDLPLWCEYHKCPDRERLNRIYNEASIFVAPSITEGWGLTVGEAMICGCAVVCTDNEGHREMATDGETALLSDIKDGNALARNIIKLIENDALRFSIANKGHDFIRKFTWGRSYRMLLQCLNTL